MIRGIYTSAAGMLVEQTRLDVVSNNIANTGTPGYKKDVPVADSFPEMLLMRCRDPQASFIGGISTGSVVSTISTDMGKGSARATGNRLDVALGDDAFFVVRTRTGEAYTRNGAFQIDADGTLVTADGYPVLGESGEIKIDLETGEEGDASVFIAEDGTVRTDEKEFGRLRIVRFDNPRGLSRLSTTVFEATDDAGPADPVEQARVQAGFLEMSNVNPVSEMVNMISIMRAYEANQKLVQAQDQTLDKAVNEIARV